MVMAMREPARHLDTNDETKAKPSQRRSSSKGRERRATTRARGPFDGAWNGASGKQAIRIADISEGGCFVESLATLPPGDRVVLTIGLPETGTIAVSGEVVTTEPGIGFAVRFPELSAAQRTAIKRTVQRLLAGDCFVEVPVLTAPDTLPTSG